MPYRATLIKGKTFNCGKYTFNASEPDRKSQIVEEEFALLLAKNEKFKIESIKESEIIKSEVIDTKEPNIFVLIDWIEEATGYGNIAKKLLNKYSGTIKYVQKGPEFKDNLDLKDVPLESYVIQLTTPNCFRDLSNVKKRIGFTMFETTKIPPDWPAICNKTLDLLIVPSEENKKVFKNCGVKVPIEVIPLWVDNSYKYYDRPKRKTFTFLFVGGVDDHNRKGWYELQKAFKQEFKEEKDVRLIFKCLFINIHNEMASQIMEDDRIKFVKGKLKNKELYKLYKKADCFVFPTHGEGFGLPPLEAMATGMPTVVTDWMGCKEFVDNKICYPLKVDKLEEALYPDTYGDVGDWAYISIKELRKQMRHVYEHQKEAKQKGKLAAEVVNEKFRFKNFTESLERIIEPEKLTNIKPINFNESTSIIILVYDCLDYFKKCLESVVKYTSSYELIIVDNGSDEITKKYISAQRKKLGFTLITNEENKGFAYGCNQGIKVASYDYICFLNSDTIVTKEWLERLKTGFNLPNVGLLGPSTSWSRTEQNIKSYSDRRFEMTDEEIQNVPDVLKKGYKEIELVGFCFLTSREVIDRIGVFDYHVSPIAYYDDVDFCNRIKRVGYKAYWIKDSYVHHYGHRTAKAKINSRKTTAEALERLLKKKDTDIYIVNDVEITNIKKREYKKIVVSVNIGNYDNPIEDHYPNPDWEYYLFTDTDIKSDFWNIIKIDRKFEPRRQSRLYKWLLCDYFPNAEFSLYIDCNYKILTDIDSLFIGDFDVFMKPHLRGDLYGEAEICKHHRLDYPNVIDKQITKIKNEGYPQNNGLHEGNAILRRHTDIVKKFGAQVWKEIENGSTRDQLSLDYVAWKFNLKIGNLPEEFFEKREHAKEKIPYL